MPPKVEEGSGMLREEEVKMRNRLIVLLIHDHPEPFGKLDAMLKDLPVGGRSIRSGDVTNDLVAQYMPALIFVDLPVWNKSWANIINLVRRADLAPNVIVVGSKPDIEVYVSAIERGAYSFVALPFLHDGLKFIVHSALSDVHDRRLAMFRATSPNVEPHTWNYPSLGRARVLRTHETPPFPVGPDRAHMSRRSQSERPARKLRRPPASASSRPLHGN